MAKLASERLTVLAPALFVLLWSTGYIGARLGTPYSEPLTFLAVRFIFAVALLIVVAMIARATWPDMRTAGHSVIVGALIHGVYLGGVFWAIDRGMPAGVAALIVGLQPVLTAFAAGPVLGESVTPKHWLGLLIGLVGVGLVIWPKLDVANEGITLATITPTLIGTVAITLGTIYQKRYSTGTDLLTGGVWQYVGAVAVVGLGALLFESFQITWTGEFIFALAWLVLVLSIGAMLLLMVLIRAGAISKVASLFYLVPAATALSAWFLFGETLTVMQLAGMAVTAFAVALVARAV